MLPAARHRTTLLHMPLALPSITSRQQLAAMQERWSGMEAAAAAAREEAEAAAAAAAKAEADLAALSSAYNGLEQHAFEMEEQLRRLQDQQQQQQGSAGGGAAGLSEADVAARVQAAIEEVSPQQWQVLWLATWYLANSMARQALQQCHRATVKLCRLAG